MQPIVFLVSGTRGDVQPIIALARGLQSARHKVCVAGPPAFREFVEGYRLPFAPIEGNPSDLLTAAEGQAALTYEGNPLHSLRATWDYVQRARPVYAQMLNSAWEVSRDASALVVGLPTLWGVSIAEALGVPCIGAFLQPMLPTGEFPSPIIPLNLRGWRGYNRFSYLLAGLAVWLPWRSLINRWRKESLRLKPLLFFGPTPAPFGKFDLALHAFSELIVPRPRDWNDLSILSGYWPLETDGYVPSPALESFLNAGESPYYFGFGSPGLRRPDETIDIILKAIQATQIRAIIAPVAGLTHRESSTDVFFLCDSVPHGWLFQRIAVAVHHGGAGTTAAALRAGIPSLVLPRAVDQFFWARRVQALGAGPRAIPQGQLTVQNLVQSLADFKNGKMAEAAQKIRAGLSAEDGVARAVEALEMILKQKPP